MDIRDIKEKDKIIDVLSKKSINSESKIEERMRKKKEIDEVRKNNNNKQEKKVRFSTPEIVSIKNN